MIDVREVYVTSEVAKMLDISTQYCLKIAKELKENGILSDSDLREAGKRNYIFSKYAVVKLEEFFSTK